MNGYDVDIVPDQKTLLEIIRVQAEIVKLGLDLGSVMDFVAEEVRVLTNASGAIVELVEDEEMVYRAATGNSKKQLGLRINKKGSLSGLCIEQGKILRCDDCEIDPRVDRAACRKVGLRSMVVAPLVSRESVVGVLKILSPEPNYFSDDHISILKLMSDLIAASMFYAVKYEINELYHRATHDALTGLANRALFYDHLRQSLAMARRQSLAVGVLNLDMDGLKYINDRYGHRAGDAAIKELALRIVGAARESDIVARLGGDEFGVILPHSKDRASVEQVAARMAQETTSAFEFERIPLQIEASVGMAVFPDDAEEIEELVEKADQGMYRVKRARKEAAVG
jgi:diguanylate cyclase (GGDEF)-like protein